MSAYPRHPKKPVLSMSDEARVRFYSKIRIGAPDECHEWTASKSSGGYGMFRAFSYNSMIHAHRVAYMLHHGVELPDTEGNSPTCVLHTCDNPSCCNPRHLWLGSRAENNDDKMRKGRDGPYLGKPPVGTGEKNGRAVLCSDDVRTLRRIFHETFSADELAKRPATQAPGVARCERPHHSDEYRRLRKALAREFRISEASLTDILTRRSWTHLPTPW